MSHKHFIFSAVSLIAFVLAISLIINTIDLPTQKNDLLRKQQFLKLSQDNKSIDTVFLGDSSCGNAINIKLFNRLTNVKGYNLALTGSFGIETDINMIKHSVASYPNLKNIVFMHTINIWEREFSYIGFFDTLYSASDLFSYSHLTDENIFLKYFAYKINPKEITWLAKKSKIKNNFDNELDYNAQKKKRFSNDMLELTSAENYQNLHIKPHKLKVWEELNSLCKQYTLNCYYLNGPIYEKIYIQDKEKVEEVMGSIKQRSEVIRFIPEIFSYPKNMIGDSEDHIDPKYKDEVTKEYVEVLKTNGF